MKQESLNVTNRSETSQHQNIITLVIITIPRVIFVHKVNRTSADTEAKVVWQKLYWKVPILYNGCHFHPLCSPQRMQVGCLGSSVVSVASCGPRGHEFDAPRAPGAQWGVTDWAANNCDCCHVQSWADCLLTVVVTRPTQPSIPPGSVNENQLWLGRQWQVWFIAFLDKHVSAQVKLWNPSTMCAVHEHF